MRPSEFTTPLTKTNSMIRKRFQIVPIAILFCFNFIVWAQSDSQWGHLTGQIVLKGEVPAIAQEDLGSNADKAEAMIDGQAPLDDNLIVNDKHQMKDILVMMYLAPGEAEPAYHESYEQVKTEPVTLDNLNCRFDPHVLFVRPGQKLVLKNSDDVGHNCHIIAFNNEHNVNLPANGSAEIVLEKPEKVPGEVKCDIHPWMDSVIMIRDNPYVAFTQADGTFKIENIPAGNWKFQFWHKKFGWLAKLDAGRYSVGKRGELDVLIKNGETTDLGLMSLPVETIKK
jgi:plastocyanin